ncbi:DUF1638 domain-containing protein [Pikeienuella sp. HZG-20]|uniref:DUF1638 domain-containing protein n=1 Tax=Paludibacillus litoralis TaxID=3133267 RepID=UPI0030ED2D81
MGEVDDAMLAEAGMEAAGAPGAGKVLLIACGALAREILALKRINGWAHMELVCLPAKLHLTPDRIPDAVRGAVRRGRAQGYAEIFVVYADCGTGGGLDRMCEEEGVARIAGPHCYSFFDGVEAFAARGDEEMRVFYLTDFLVKQFDAFVIRPMGLDRHPELRDMLFGNYEELVYLAQTDDPALDRAAEAAAKRLGLAYRRRFTGYGDLAPALAGLKGARAGAQSALT